MDNGIFYIPFPVGVFIFLCVVCLRIARRSDNRRSVFVIPGPNQTQIPPQFESARSPIITFEDEQRTNHVPSTEDEQRANDVPPTYENVHRYHQWQQQQMSRNQQYPHPQDDHAKALQGWNQQHLGEATGAPPDQVNPTYPGPIQPGMVAEKNQKL